MSRRSAKPQAQVIRDDPRRAFTRTGNEPLLPAGMGMFDSCVPIRPPAGRYSSGRLRARGDLYGSRFTAISGLYGRRDAWHAGVRAAVEQARALILLPAPTLGENDYLLRVRLGNPALLRFLADVQEGAFVVETVTLADLRRCAALISKYSDLDLGISDASVVAVAERLGTDRILTVDQRDFRVIRSAHGRPFNLLPANRRKS